MPPSIQQEQLQKFGNWVAPRLNKLEIILVTAFTIGIGLRIMAIPNAYILFLLSLSILAMLYFITAFATSENQEVSSIELFIDKLVNLASSIACIGILFSLQNWHGAANPLIVGSSTLIISFFTMILLKLRKKESGTFNKRLILRAVVIGVVGLSLHLTPKEKLVDLGVIKKVNTEQTSNSNEHK